MKKSNFILAIMLCTFSVYSQDFEVPVKYKLEKAEDFKFYEADILKCIDWLIETPLNEHKAKRKEANAFLLAWLTGSPNVTIELSAEIVTFMESSPELLMVFFGGWTKHVLQSNVNNDPVAGNLAGIETIIYFYQKNKKLIPKDKNVEKYIKMKDKGTLKSFIESKI